MHPVLKLATYTFRTRASLLNEAAHCINIEFTSFEYVARLSPPYCISTCHFPLLFRLPLENTALFQLTSLRSAANQMNTSFSQCLGRLHFMALQNPICAFSALPITLARHTELIYGQAVSQNMDSTCQIYFSGCI